MQIHSRSKKPAFSFDNNILQNKLRNTRLEKVWETYGKNLNKNKQVSGISIQSKLLLAGVGIGFVLMLYTVAKG